MIKNCLFNTIAYIIIIVALSAKLVVADDQQKQQAVTQVLFNDDKNVRLQLDVKQMQLANVLKTLSDKTGIPIHYSVLPDGVITATCVGKTLKPVLECLLDHKADVIVRFKRQDKNVTPQTTDIAEAWVLGSKLEAMPAEGVCQSDGAEGKISLIDESQTIDPNPALLAKPSQSDELLKVVKNGDPEERAQAIGDLLMIGRQNDPKVKEFLERAVHDQDENVRAQAVSTLAHREDYSERAPEIIREALQDQSADVRLMAVDSINDDVALLQQAINDSDETVRITAELKLVELTQEKK